MNQNKAGPNNKNYTINSTKMNKEGIDSLKKEVDSIIEIDENTKDFLLLEIHSKLEQYQFKQETLIEQISSENEFLKIDLLDKEELNQTLTKKYDNANKIIEDKKNTINMLNEMISAQESIITSFNEETTLKNKVIDENNEKINELTSNIIKLTSEKDEVALENETKTNEINRMTELLGEKDILNSDLILKLQEKDTVILDNKKIAKQEIAKLNDNIAQKNEINNDLTSILNKKDETIYEKDKSINRLNNEISEKNKIVLDNENKLGELKKIISQLEKSINDNNQEISALNSKNKTLLNEKENLKNSLNSKNEEIKNQKIILSNNKKEINELNLIKGQYIKQLATLDTNQYFMNDLKNELENKDLEIRYLKNNNLVKKILSPFSYAYLILKSKPKEISLNLKLYKSLKDSDEFDIGHYLANNEDIKKSKWTKYFSPQLHYVCRGFDEKREINKRYFKAVSKKELLDYIHSVTSHKN